MKVLNVVLFCAYVVAFYVAGVLALGPLNFVAVIIFPVMGILLAWDGVAAAEDRWSSWGNPALNFLRFFLACGGVVAALGGLGFGVDKTGNITFHLLGDLNALAVAGAIFGILLISFLPILYVRFTGQLATKD